MGRDPIMDRVTNFGATKHSNNDNEAINNTKLQCEKLIQKNESVANSSSTCRLIEIL